MESRRERGRSNYRFLPTDNFEVFAKETSLQTEIIKKKNGRKNSGGGIDPRMSPDMMEMYEGGLDQMSTAARVRSRLAQINALLIGTDYKLDSVFYTDILGDDGARVVLDKMRLAGVVIDQRAVEFVEGARASLVIDHDGFGEISLDLTRLLTNGDYAEGINITMEFISRVGLKEASSDWKLAVILRQLNDQISRANPDLKEGFEARQQLRFLPNINSIMPEKFGEIAAQVMAKPSIDLGLSPEMSFMMGTQVTLVNGEKLNVSTAMFKDLLRSEKNSMKLLDANINTTDSTLENIFIEHVWGKGAKISEDKKKIILPGGGEVLMDSKVKMEFFDIDVRSKNFGKPNGKPIEVTVRQMLNRTHWMLQDAQQYWWYGREWEKYLANYSKEQMESSPKGLAAAGRMWGAYKSEFEQVSRTMHDVAMLGAMLQPNEVYKINDAIKMNVRERIINAAEKDPRWESDPGWRRDKADLAEKTGELFVKLMSNRVEMSADSDSFEFILDTISREEMRLIGNEIDVNNFTEVWQITRERFIDLGMSELDIPDERLAKVIVERWDGERDKTKITDEETRFWGKQVEEIRAIIEMRKFSAEDMAVINRLNLNNLQDLAPLFETQELVHGRKVVATNMKDLFKELEFSTIVNWAKSNQGDDPFQIGAKYYQNSLEAGKYLVKIVNLMGTNEDMAKLHELMSSYVPAPELRKFEIILNHRLLLSRTNQIIPYEVVAQKKGAESPNAFDFITMVDSRKRKWQVRGRHGERGVVKTMYSGNFGWKEKRMWGWRDSDVEQRTRYLNAIGYLTKDKAEYMYEQAAGVGREVKWLFHKLGLTSPTAKRIEHFIAHWGSKAKGLLKKHPLFDDPIWAFWSIANEFVEYTKEVGKEITKEVSH